ncbi:hypothetical protein [Ferrimonas balearica]|uniref:hypothetical protein n=1 Tax=Ferrimonas balearica TaxID=44012 RepID=UPI001C992DA0|nr:hypothetical protein [Ferrimonas balearica]MBY5923080.1 hypothetical protein [Ferrimonas balearica]MBY5997544.1 hypothetical protein [Ferrimonas balearica]
MKRYPRVSAMAMVFWLLAISLAAPAHELSHVHDDITLSEQCDFFAHQTQLQQLFSHLLPDLATVVPFRWQPLSLPATPTVNPLPNYSARAPPADPRV